MIEAMISALIVAFFKFQAISLLNAVGRMVNALSNRFIGPGILEDWFLRAWGFIILFAINSPFYASFSRLNLTIIASVSAVVMMIMYKALYAALTGEATSDSVYRDDGYLEVRHPSKLTKLQRYLPRAFNVAAFVHDKMIVYQPSMLSRFCYRSLCAVLFTLPISLMLLVTMAVHYDAGTPTFFVRVFFGFWITALGISFAFSLGPVRI